MSCNVKIKYHLLISGYGMSFQIHTPPLFISMNVSTETWWKELNRDQLSFIAYKCLNASSCTANIYSCSTVFTCVIFIQVGFVLPNALSMSVISIRGCHSLMTPTNDTFIHGWHFSIHGWHPQMTLLHPWMTSKDSTFIHGWGFSIYELNFYLSEFLGKLYASFENINIWKYDAYNFPINSDG